jgi:hypothetical protein
LLQLNSLPEVAAVAMAAAGAMAAAAGAMAEDLAAAEAMAEDLAAAEAAPDFQAAMSEASAEAAPDFQAAMSEASAEAAPDFQAAVSGACTPLRLVPLASGQCLVPDTVQASTGMSGLADSIIAGSSSLAATVAITTAVIRFGMATLG